MSLINHKIKIATILPYKENYTFSKAQAAAIWVADFLSFQNNKKIIFLEIHQIKIT